MLCRNLSTCFSLAIVSCITLLTTLLTGCGGDDSFNVSATVEGLGTQNVRAIYRSGGRINVIPAMALDGKFNFSGAAERPVLIDIYSSSRGRIGSLIAVNGQTIEVAYTLNEPGKMTVKGSRESEDLAKFIRENSEIVDSRDTKAINRAVADYVAKYPDRQSTPFIFLSMFSPDEDNEVADSLLDLMSPDIMPSGDIISSYRSMLKLAPDSVSKFGEIRLYAMGDSMATIAPGKSRGVLLVFTNDDGAYSRENTVKRLNELTDTLKKVARVAELSLVNDTSRLSILVKSHYTVCWEPGGLAAPTLSHLDIDRIPWAVAADSTGQVLYSGPELDEALKQLRR